MVFSLAKKNILFNISFNLLKSTQLYMLIYLLYTFNLKIWRIQGETVVDLGEKSRLLVFFSYSIQKII